VISWKRMFPDKEIRRSSVRERRGVCLHSTRNLKGMHKRGAITPRFQRRIQEDAASAEGATPQAGPVTREESRACD
jgi:hypothetical protein